MHEGPHIVSGHATVRHRQIQHGIDHALARPVIGPLAATAGLVSRETIGILQILRLGGSAGGIERRVLDQPDQFGRIASLNGGDARLHGGNRLIIIGQTLGGQPVQCCCCRIFQHGL